MANSSAEKSADQTAEVGGGLLAEARERKPDLLAPLANASGEACAASNKGTEAGAASCADPRNQHLVGKPTIHVYPEAGDTPNAEPRNNFAEEATPGISPKVEGGLRRKGRSAQTGRDALAKVSGDRWTQARAFQLVQANAASQSKASLQSAVGRIPSGLGPSVSPDFARAISTAFSTQAAIDVGRDVRRGFGGKVVTGLCRRGGTGFGVDVWGGSGHLVISGLRTGGGTSFCTGVGAGIRPRGLSFHHGPRKEASTTFGRLVGTCFG